MLEAFIDVSSNKGPPMPTSKPANHMSRTLLLAGDSKNTVLAEMAGRIHRLVYSPYGQQSSPQEVMTHLGFNGELREAKTDWYFLGMGYRVYNPRLMRFHSYDKFSPFGKGGLNGYAYCGCEPVMRADPNGEGWVFKVFAYLNEFFSGSGSGGGSLRITNTAVVPVSTSRSTFSTPSRLKPLGKSRKHSSAFPVRQPDHHPTTKTVPTERRTKFVLEGNYGKRDQNEYSKVKTPSGLSIKGTDSGVKQFPTTASGIRQPLE